MQLADLATKKPILIASLPILSLSAGFLVYGPVKGLQAADAVDLVHALLSVGIIFAWFLFDAREREYRASWFLKAAVLCLSFFALPYYFFKSRGFKRGIKTLGLSLLVFTITMVFYRIGALIG